MREWRGFLLWNLLEALASAEFDATTIVPFSPLNVTLSVPGNWTSVGAVIGRVGVAVGVAGAVGVMLYLLKKTCPKESEHGERPPVVELQPVNGGTASSDVAAAGSPLLESNKAG